MEEVDSWISHWLGSVVLVFKNYFSGLWGTSIADAIFHIFFPISHGILIILLSYMHTITANKKT